MSAKVAEIYRQQAIEATELVVQKEARIVELEAENASLREAVTETPERIRELAQFVDPKHHEKFHQLADVLTTLIPEAALAARDGGSNEA